MLEAVDDFLTMKEVTVEDGQPDLLISMDREKINTVGQEAIAKFLLKVQSSKSTGDLAAAKEMYDRYSEVSELRRQILVDRKQTRSILVQANTRLVNEKLELMQYEPDQDVSISFISIYSLKYKRSRIF